MNQNNFSEDWAAQKLFNFNITLPGLCCHHTHLFLMELNKKVCVIGAGVSGLKAAHTLLNSPGSPFNPEDVIVLEAQDRVGGRIKTDRTSSKLGASYDLGAAWFHDVLTNSVLRDSIASGIFDPQIDGYFDDKATAYHALEALDRIDVEELKLKQVVEDIETFIEIYYSSLDAKDVLLRDIVSVYMEKQRVFLTEEQMQYCGRMMRYLELWYGIDQDRISGKYAIMSHQGRNLYNKKGYSCLIDSLMDTISCQVATSEPVRSIRRKSSPNDLFHTVTTKSGAKINAEYLVVTVPHSILALPEDHEYALQWQPALPKPMTDSFQSIHFGALGKVILEFDYVWWDTNQDRIVVLGNESESRSLSSQPMLTTNSVPDTEAPRSFDYPIYVVNYARIYPGTSSLVVLTQSPVTEYLEENPHLAWEYLEPLLRTIQTNSFVEVRKPLNMIVTDWTRNPYIRGSYCALHVGDDPIDEIVQLSGEHDLCGLGSESTVRFAGEHTASDGAGCVHGAYDSGERAANWILNHALQKK